MLIDIFINNERIVLCMTKVPLDVDRTTIGVKHETWKRLTIIRANLGSVGVKYNMDKVLNILMDAYEKNQKIQAENKG